jgi:2-amino-4-hydroxy-6-hydroxymethyldihydropteridine diphosphokinase
LSEIGKPDRKRVPCEKKHRRSRRQTDHLVYIGLGSNIEPEVNLPRALDLLCEHVELEALSMVWETPPEGLKGRNFLNAAVRAKTHLPRGVLKTLVLRPIEIQLGRVRTANKYAPRTIDLDILIYDEQVVEKNIWKQTFIAKPLSELLPDLTNPETGESLQEAAQRLASDIMIKPRPEVLRRE